MSEEKRKFFRSQCVLPAEVKKIEGKDNLIDRTTAHDFSDEGLKVTISFNINPGSLMELKVYLPEKKISTILSGEIMWVRSADEKLEAGLKIKEMDKKLKKEILEWVFPGWLKEKNETKKKREKK